jgi:hypothetical protein
VGDRPIAAETVFDGRCQTRRCDQTVSAGIATSAARICCKSG